MGSARVMCYYMLHESANPIYVHRCPPPTCPRAFGNRWTGRFFLEHSPCLTLSVFTPTLSGILKMGFQYTQFLCVPLLTKLHRSFGFIVYHLRFPSFKNLRFYAPRSRKLRLMRTWGIPASSNSAPWTMKPKRS